MVTIDKDTSLSTKKCILLENILWTNINLQQNTSFFLLCSLTILK